MDQGPFGPVQSKPYTRAPHAQKFPYMDQGKSLAFIPGGVAPRGSLHLASLELEIYWVILPKTTSLNHLANSLGLAYLY
jgi:hypothetical protein